MKKLFFLILFSSAFIYGQNDSLQVYKSGWYVGGGVSYPRYMTISEKSIAAHENFGFFLTLGYNITEHFGFRLSPQYLLLHSFYYGDVGQEVDNYLNMGVLNLEAVYSILPCEDISPYVLIGYGATYFKSGDPYLGPHGDRDWIKDAYTGYQATLGLGAEFKFWNDLSITAEFDYITASNNKIDGNEHVNEIKGLLASNGDSYMNLRFGAQWHFWRGEKSNICEPYGIREVVREVEVPVEKVVVDTVYIKEVVAGAVEQKKAFVLENVRFKFNEAELTPEAQIILTDVADVLNEYPEYDFEILGHTDNIGSDEYNMDLSDRRAMSVKNFLVAKGVEPARLHTSGCGERKPVADNSTELGRSINRRIEFSIYDGVSSKCEKTDDGMSGNASKLENAVKTGNEEEVVIEGIFFKFDSDELTEDSEKTLDKVAEVLSRYPNAQIEIQGHTDSLGVDMYNQYLSERRAASVKKYLVNKGINSSNLSTVGYGESRPRESNETNYGRAVNRRIEFKVINNSNIKIKTTNPTIGYTEIKDGSKDEIKEVLSTGKKLVFTNINFNVNSDVITDQSIPILDNVVSVLSELNDLNVEIQGHTDSDGSAAYNQELSTRRAKSVEKYLVDNGINADRLNSVGYGETNPIAKNDSAENKAKNRRIEFAIIN